jgi:membrane protease YdiL (CAAX protease family)
MDITAEAPVPPHGKGMEIGGRRIDWTPKDVLFGVLWFLALFIAAPIPIATPFAVVWGDESSEFYAASLILSMVAEAGIVVVAAMYTFRKYGGSWERLGLGPITWRHAAWGLAAFVGAIIFAFAYGLIIEALDAEALKSDCDDQLPKDILNNTALLALAGITIIGFAPLCEEIFFRGFIFTGLANGWGVVAGIVASGFVFSMAHLGLNLHKTFVPILGIGIIFAFCYWRSGNLVSTILAHLIFNSMSYVVLTTRDCP